MPADATRHPNDANLLAYAAGRLRARNRAPIEAHLGECDRCVGRLDILFARAKPDPLLKRIRAVGGPKTVSDATPFTGRPQAALVQGLSGVHRVAPPEFTYALIPGRRHVLAGVVQQAREQPGGKVVTVTFLSPDPTRTPAGRERVVELLRQLYAVEHPNLLMPRSVRLVGEAWGIVSDDADGIDFHALACAVNRPGVERVSGYFHQAAAGLAAAHASGVVHGDLELSDLKLFDRATVRVMGFLTARLRSGPPPSDPAQDVLALGRCFAAMLSGRTYGKGQTATPYSPGADVKKSPPTQLDRVLSRFAADSPEPFATMAEAAEALAKLASRGRRQSFWHRLFAFGS
jgi:hypothetical protein